MSAFKDVATFVDPKNGPVEKWRGCTLFKPNAKEAEALSGLKDWREQCLYFKEKLDCRYVVITQSGAGVVGYDGAKFYEYRSKQPILVESVIGAGDCFMAVLAMAVTHGFDLEASMQIAYEAGKLYVQKRLNRPIVPGELSASKIIHPFDVVSRDFELVFTNGCFDLLHPGHLKILREAKEMGDKLLVAVNSDASVKRLKGEKRPVMSQQARVEMLAAIDAVDFVAVFEEDTPLEAIKACRPNVLVKGGDYPIDQIVGADIVDDVRNVPLVEGMSTTKLISLLLE
jgi:D-beta-D-heptose 7-phosphate kinase/D-beta-D-heptose 1-phosphate adenosyltransferase